MRNYRQISHMETEQLMNDQGIVIISVRDQDSYEEGCVANAMLLYSGKTARVF